MAYPEVPCASYEQSPCIDGVQYMCYQDQWLAVGPCRSGIDGRFLVVLLVGLAAGAGAYHFFWRSPPARRRAKQAYHEAKFRATTTGGRKGV